MKWAINPAWKVIDFYFLASNILAISIKYHLIPDKNLQSPTYLTFLWFRNTKKTLKNHELYGTTATPPPPYKFSLAVWWSAPSFSVRRALLPLTTICTFSYWCQTGYGHGRAALAPGVFRMMLSRGAQEERLPASSQHEHDSHNRLHVPYAKHAVSKSRCNHPGPTY